MNYDVNKIISNIFIGTILPEMTSPDTLIKDMRRHCIHCLLGTNKAYEKVLPIEYHNKIRKGIFHQIKTYSDVLFAQTDLTHLLENIGVKAIILKGFSAAKYYPDPALRTIGDIDFLIKGELSVEQVADFLAANGYEVEEYKNPVSRYYWKLYGRHLIIRKNGVIFELHSHFSHRITSFDHAIDDILESVEPIVSEISGNRFYSLPDAENGIVLLEHVAYHFSTTGIGYKQIIDWLCYADKVMSDEFWNSEFRPLAERAGLVNLAVHITRMCELLFGLPVHEFSKSADENVCYALAEEIYQAGNFGTSYGELTSKISEVKNTESIFSRLQRGGMLRWEAARKHMVLAPFAWLYQFIRIIGVMIKNRGLKSLSQASQLAESKDRLFQSLSIGRYRGIG